MSHFQYDTTTRKPERSPESPPAPWATKKSARLAPRLGLRAHLVGLVLAVLLPALAVGGAAAWHAASAYRQAFEARLLDTARALSLAISSEFDTLGTAALALASAPSLRDAADSEIPAMRTWAAEIAQGLGGARVVVKDAAPGHRQLLDTGLSKAALVPSPSVSGHGGWDLIRRVAETGRPAVSDLFTSPGSSSWA
ncbi:hypothetical protein, partial [Siccirubricoccus deserti]|uniref:hypothetical protein n=1 Tax=Siccirubricoccus deserti TaxID=2013562 RepID=UPI001C950A9A